MVTISIFSYHSILKDLTALVANANSSGVNLHVHDMRSFFKIQNLLYPLTYGEVIIRYEANAAQEIEFFHINKPICTIKNR